MSRHLDNLKRVLQKFQFRYGENDAIVLQVKQEIDSHHVIESRLLGWPFTYRERLSGEAADRHWRRIR